MVAMDSLQQKKFSFRLEDTMSRYGQTLTNFSVCDHFSQSVCVEKTPPPKKLKNAQPELH